MNTQRAIVLCADDYAQSAAVSAGIRALAEAGRLSATSAMVLAPGWPREAEALAPLAARIDVGLHLDWTSPFAQRAGHGMALVRAMRRAAWGGFDVAAARGVIERQLDAFEAAWGAPPDHIDGHQHVQQFAGVREALVQAIEARYGGAGARRPWLRVSRAAPGHRTPKARLIAWMGAHALETIAARAGVASAGALFGIYDFTGDEAAYAARMARWLRDAPNGAVLMCHPGAPGGSAGRDADDIAAAREVEFAYLGSAAFADALRHAGVRLARGSALF